MRIGLITTLNTNIGDDLIREGVVKVLKEVIKNEISFVFINKHRPATVYPPYHPVRWTDILPRCRISVGRLVGRLFYRFGHSYFDNCELIVQCGSPVLWPNCHRAEWVDILWHQVVGRLYTRIPVLNLGAGSSYPWEQQPTDIDDPEDAKYLKAILNYCKLTTVRDILAQQLCSSLGVQVPLIPCPAFLAAKDLEIKERNGTDIIIINFMPKGGHWTYEQKISPSEWHVKVKALISRLKRYYKLVFLCHGRSEYEAAYELDPTIPRLWPKNVQEYFKYFNHFKVKAALCNRIHASVALAGLGIPSIAVGADTRLLTVHALGLPCIYVKEANVSLLEDTLNNLINHHRHEKERLLALRSDVWNRYIQVVSETIF